MLKENLEQVEKNIAAACKRAGRDRSEVTLIAVSKTKPVSDIREIYDLGVRTFGENKVQELCSKTTELPDDIKWHLIGHLQRNKVRQVIEHAALIHSVDSYRLAEEINIQAMKRKMEMPVLIEVNIAEEESKFGVRADETEQLVREIAELTNIRIRGLMTIAPYVVDPEENRDYFRKIRQLAVDIKNKNIDNVSMGVLSMGMTGDYEVAIEEGATMVRVGTGIFGARNYSAS